MILVCWKSNCVNKQLISFEVELQKRQTKGKIVKHQYYWPDIFICVQNHLTDLMQWINRAKLNITFFVNVNIYKLLKIKNRQKKKVYILYGERYGLFQRIQNKM